VATIFDKQGVVLDTTLIVLWFRCNHWLRTKALAIRNDFLHGKIDILIPDLALYELELALHQCSSYDANKIDLAIHSLQGMGLQIISTSALCLVRAWEIAVNLFVSLPAAYFLAVAEHYGCQYWTADEEFYAKVSDWHIVRLIK